MEVEAWGFLFFADGWMGGWEAGEIGVRRSSMYVVVEVVVVYV